MKNLKLNQTEIKLLKEILENYDPFNIHHSIISENDQLFKDQLRYDILNKITPPGNNYNEQL